MEEHEIRFSGRRYPARLLAKKLSGPADIALFFVPGHKLSPTYRIAESSPAIGEAAWMVGYPRTRNGSYRKTDGSIQATRVVGYEYQFSRPAIEGESGGPLFVKYHQVVGVVTHRADGSSLVTTLPQIRKFLTSTIGGIPNCNKPIAPPPPREDSPTPRVQPVQPSPGLEELINRISALEVKIEALESRQPQKGDRGDKGEQGDPGPERTVTVIIEDSAGKQLTAPVRIPPGKKRVRIPIERFTRKGQ